MSCLLSLPWIQSRYVVTSNTHSQLPSQSIVITTNSRERPRLVFRGARLQGLEKSRDTLVVHSSDPTPVRCCPKNQIGAGSEYIAAKIFKHFSNCDLAMMALCLEEKDASEVFHAEQRKTQILGTCCLEKKICRRRVFHTF
ncbi:hypothetical protein JTB14_024929 [Gonioctena quinquepunctata]|nr:hypothetical protein JTB14_024929 [Gonioctena quinquepunctata]